LNGGVAAGTISGMDPAAQPTITLNNGVAIPAVGLGVFRVAEGDATRRAVLAAIEAGYRHIDTARAYGNERDVGQAIRESGVPRERLFVTTKLFGSDHGYEMAKRACRKSLKLLGLSYLDLYLIHWPVPELRGESWIGLQDLLDEGLCRAIGVSNYTNRHMDELLEYADVVPAVNQVELHPFLNQKDLLEHNRRHGIVVEAYSPLTHGRRIDDPRIGVVAARYGRTNAQVMIRWCLQRGTVVLPKSTRPERIRENLSVFDFELAPGDMEALDALHENLHTCWDPTNAP
jgi:methylglyoxal/glyoxal reductase